VPDFIRARSSAQKEQRMAEIKQAADELFHEKSYHEITLKGISERLGWSHAALYKYVSTKEDIFLELCADARGEYVSSLLAAYPSGCSYSHEVLAQVWTEQLNSHRDYLAYSDLLFTIIETNVSAERLAEFKRGYFEETDLLSKRFHENLGIEPDRAGQLFNSVLFHAVSINGWCAENPLVAEAMEIAGLEQRVPDFKEEMRDFIEMCLAHYCR
jgi:AcrR family transcriptional regulator